MVGIFAYGNSTDRKENFSHKETGMSEVAELHTVSCAAVRDISEKKSLLMIVIFTSLMHIFFILIHLLYSCACSERCYAHLREDNCIGAASGVVALFG